MKIPVDTPRYRAASLAISVLLVWGLTSGLDFWLAPLVIAFLWTLAVKSTTRQYIGAVVLSLAGYALPLLIASFDYPLGKSANLIAAIMGFGRAGLIVWVFTFLLALLLGLAGAWLGHVVRLVLVGRQSQNG